MSDHKLSAKPRKLFGRKVKSLRREGVIPGNVFGKKTKSISIQVGNKELVGIIKAAGETGLIDLTIEGESKPRPVLISGYAQDPVSSALLHVDFHQVDLTVKTTAAVPVEVVGEAPAAVEGNVLVVLKQELEVEALPADLPDKIGVDVTGLKEIGDSILAKDLKLDRAKVALLVDDEEPIVTIQAPAKEEVVEAPAEEEGEGAEGAEPAKEEDEKKEGEAKPSEPDKPSETKE